MRSSEQKMIVKQVSSGCVVITFYAFLTILASMCIYLIFE